MTFEAILIIQMLARRDFTFLGHSRLKSKTEEQGHTLDSARPRGKDLFCLDIGAYKNSTVVWLS